MQEVVGSSPIKPTMLCGYYLGGAKLNFIKNNYMKILACLIWIIGIPAGVVLGYRPDVNVRGGSSMYGGSTSGSTEYVFSWTQAAGYWALFLAIGFIAFQLAIVIQNQKKSNHNIHND